MNGVGVKRGICVKGRARLPWTCRDRKRQESNCKQNYDSLHSVFGSTAEWTPFPKIPSYLQAAMAFEILVRS